MRSELFPGKPQIFTGFYELVSREKKKVMMMAMINILLKNNFIVKRLIQNNRCCIIILCISSQQNEISCQLTQVLVSSVAGFRFIGNKRIISFALIKYKKIFSHAATKKKSDRKARIVHVQSNVLLVQNLLEFVCSATGKASSNIYLT